MGVPQKTKSRSLAASLLHITVALLCEINEEWLTGKTYLNMNPAGLPKINR